MGIQKLATYLSMIAILGWLGCEDPRATQREENIFNPDNAFIRFNFDNQVNTPAKDSVIISASAPEDSLLVIPIALSAAPQTQEVLVQVTYEAPDSLAPANNWMLFGEDGESVFDRNLSIIPGTFDYELTFNRLDTLPYPGRLILLLEKVSPDFINLGFPGSGRGQTFELIIQE